MLCQKDAMYWLYWNSSDILEHFDKIWPAWRPLCCDSPFQKRQDLRNAFNTSWYIIVHPSSISVEDPYPIPLTRKRFPALHAENIRKRQSIKTSFQSHCKLSDRVYVCFFLILLIFFYLLAWYSMPWSWSFFPGTAPAIAVTSTAFEGCFLKHCQGAQNGKTGCKLLFNAVHCNVITLTVRDFFELFDTDCTCWFWAIGLYTSYSVFLVQQVFSCFFLQPHGLILLRMHFWSFLFASGSQCATTLGVRLFAPGLSSHVSSLDWI